MSDEPEQHAPDSWDEKKTLPAGKEQRKSDTDLYLERGRLDIQKLGEFRIVREVGRGSMGVVYEAEQENLRRRVALKILPQSVDLDRKTLKRFLREAESLANLDHPNIVPIYGTGTDKGIHYYAMQFIDGPTLAKRNSTHAIPFDESAALARDVARALQCAHERGIVHRDIKPANLIFSGSGKVMITDFGLARDESAGTITESGTLIGTPMYMSPEQITGSLKGIDRLSDVYSLGATLYETVVGVPPFKAESFQATLRKIAEEEPRPPRKVNPRVPKDLETVVMTAMHKDRRRRYQSAQELADDLDRYLKREPLHARPTTVFERGFAKVRKHRTPLFIGALVVIPALIAVVALGFTNQSKSLQARYLEAYNEATDELSKGDMETLLAESNQADDARAIAHYEQARTLFDEVIRIDSKRVDGYLGMGDVLRALGDDHGAMRNFNRAVDLDADNSDALAKRGILYLRSEEFRDRELARQDLLRAQVLAPENTEVLLSLGVLELESQRISDARRYLLMAAEKDAQNSLVHYLLGLVYRQEGEYTKAAESLQTARALKPTDEAIRVQLASVLQIISEEDEQEPSADPETAVAAAPTPSDDETAPTQAARPEDLLAVGTEIFSFLGRPILGPFLPITLDGDPEGEQELTTGPPYLEGLSQPDILGLSEEDPPKGVELPDLGPQIDGVRDVFDAVVSTFYTPGSPRRTRLDEEAETLAELDQKLSETRDPELFVRRGDLRWKEKNDWTGAEADYRSALELAPEDVGALKRLAFLLVTVGEQEADEKKRAALAGEAIRLSEKAVAGNPGDPDAQFTLGRSYFVAGRIDDAIRTVTALISSHAGSPQFRTYLDEAARYDDAKKALNSTSGERR